MRDQEVQDTVAALLTAWHRYKLGKANEAEVSQWIDLLATRTDVETFGSIGEVVPFKPFEHFPITYINEATTGVEIDTFGVRAIREDGSHRVLTKAIVKPQGG
jgi:hypothetical protein